MTKLGLHYLKFAIKTLGNNIQLKKELDKKQIEVYKIHQEYEKYKRDLENKYAGMDKRNNTLARDNRKLMTIDRKKDKQIIELKNKIKQAGEYIENNLIQNDISVQDFREKYKELLEILRIDNEEGNV